MSEAPTTPTPAVAWALALAAAQAATPTITKDRFNSHAGSSFAPASEFIALSRVLADHNLLAFELGSDVVEGPKAVIYLEVTYAVVHTASGHERDFRHRMALAGHLGDKALTSARTVGMRDFLRGLLLPEVVDGDPTPNGGGRGRSQGRRQAPRQDRGPRGQAQGRAPGRRGGPAPGYGGPVSLNQLPRVLDQVTVKDGARVQAFEDRDAWALTDWPSSRGEQLVFLAGEWLQTDLMKVSDAQRGAACAQVQANRGPFQQFVHRVAIRELAQHLVKATNGKAKGLPSPDQIGQLVGDKLLRARQRLELRVRGNAYGWDVTQCPACEGKPGRVDSCERCDGTGSVRHPKHRPAEGAAA